ncbi:MAG TPA: 16S rRNA (cytosine(967)-C(5))-methyltransferase RsmB [Verrucomicrobiae bacterium]|nr:16S rRNA (cytosine(967)-C(5))-methyltransferase RsmB [Verrucomicrobiae bacterium]
MNARALALNLLNNWQKSRQLADELLEAALASSPLVGPDRAFVTELFYGCLRRKLSLEFLITQLANTPPQPVVANILQLGLYQLFYLKTPAHAAVNETVSLAKSQAHASEAKFVNAILRRAEREHGALVSRLEATREAAPWIYYSHPQWLWERWTARLGRGPAAALCEWNNQPPPIYIRINTLKTSTKPADVEAEPTTHPLCWRILNASGLFQGKSFTSGEFYVQDPSTLTAVDVLDPQPGESVLDMCAAPGGKTTYLAQKMQNRGRIIAADMSSSRLALVGENCRRLGVTIVATLACEGTHLDRCLRGDQFDRVLLDAPCSNTGVLRRRADLRWRIEESEICKLATLQEKLLAAAVPFTKPQGILVYSTCSLEEEENQRVVERFSKSHPEFTLEATRSSFPPRDSMDGAFVARFRNTNAAQGGIQPHAARDERQEV